MNNVAVISVDMFQTLVNVNSRCEDIWRRLLLHQYARHLAKEYWFLTTKLIFSFYDELFRQDRAFVNSRKIMELAFHQLSKQTGLNLQPEEAAQILVEEHGLSLPYEDTKNFLHDVGKQFPICVVSDADGDMIQPLMKLYPFDRVFTSEQYQSYKGSAGGRIFQAVVEHYAVAPERILHIGDSKYDVWGAKRAGLKDCWLNRKGAIWQNDPQPAYTAASLREVASLLLGERE